jgi:predicted ATP-grasp superfamily ATP-dependent carboligase
MIGLARTLGGKPVLISSSDQYVSAIADHADALADHFLLSPAARLQGLLATKQTQYDLAARHGMPMPRTSFVHSQDEVEAFAALAEFPCLIKPIHFREWQAFPKGHRLSHTKVAISVSPAELIANWRLAATVNPQVIVQEIIRGPDTAKRVYLSCYDGRSRRIANALFRELRCDPVGFGPATVSEPVVDTETDVVCDSFLRSIGYAGICEIEMKRDARDGQVKLIEANPRLSGGGDAAPHAGVDLCWLHYLDMIGREVEPVAPDGRDFRHVVLRPDWSTIVEYRRAGLITWADVLRSYKPPLAFFDLDRRDWLYSAETLYVAGRGALAALLRRASSNS